MINLDRNRTHVIRDTELIAAMLEAYIYGAVDGMDVCSGMDASKMGNLVLRLTPRDTDPSPETDQFIFNMATALGKARRRKDGSFGIPGFVKCLPKDAEP